MVSFDQGGYAAMWQQEVPALNGRPAGRPTAQEVHSYGWPAGRPTEQEVQSYVGNIQTTRAVEAVCTDDTGRESRASEASVLH